MNSRDAILQRIQAEVSKSEPVDRPAVPEVWALTDTPPEQLIQRFTDELAAVTGEVVRCKSMEDAGQKLIELASEAGWTSIGAADRPLCRQLAAGLPDGQITWAKDGWPPAEMAKLSTGLIAAESLLADTGSCVTECLTAEERLLCFLPPVSVVIARVDQLHEHMPAAWEEIARRTAETDRRGEFVIITGPSRTADIEKILILGVHGPKRLVVLLVDE